MNKTLLSTLMTESVSTESISHQLDPLFFNALVEGFRSIREGGMMISSDERRNAEILQNSKIAEITKKYTGLNIQFITQYRSGYDAYTIPPMLDKNHPFYDQLHRDHIPTGDRDALIRKIKRPIRGSVDLKKGRVSGDYANITVSIIIGDRFLSEADFKVEEVAAIYAHEVGHTMTYFEYLGRMVTLTHVLGSATQAFNQSKSDRQRTEVYSATCEMLGIPMPPDEIVRSTKANELFVTYVVSETANPMVSSTSSAKNDTVTWEAMSDQYVSRIGGGRYLITGLDRLHRMYDDPAMRTRRGFVFWQIGATVLNILIASASVVAMMSGIGSLVLAGMLVFGFQSIMLLSDSNDSPTYDNVKDRLSRVRRDMVDSLKSKNLTREQRLRIQEAIREADEIIKPLVDNAEFWLSRLIDGMSPGRRRDKRHKALLYDFERLINNNLFVKANDAAIAAGDA